ncbi:nucleoside deaminase [Streptomyces sp. NPDC006510]|uniref:nucleoside deaminase n=1 Tax=Streptomyces sp. NPDC006510 TaxID=3155600 RepID=UPI0033BA4326
MLQGCTIYTSGAPCPMCMSAIYWARIGTVYYGCDWKATQKIGFDDAFQYADFAKPPDRHSITLEQIHPELGPASYRAWADKANKHPY